MAINFNKDRWLAGANSQGYRRATQGTIPEAHPFNGHDNLIARVGIGNTCWGSAWKPGAKSNTPGAMKIDAFLGDYQAFIAHLTAPAWCEPTDAPQPVFYIISDGFAKPTTISAGYRFASFCGETRPEDIILASLCRSIRDSAYASKLGTHAPEEIRTRAQGKIVLQARTVGLPHVSVRSF